MAEPATIAPFSFYEFFAGGGMARAGLGPLWRCLWANDLDPLKARAYADNWGAGHFQLGDVFEVRAGDLPGSADLAWASSPCQDFSLAGRRAGLAGVRSSAFWGFWRVMQGLERDGRAPRLIVIENVLGLLTSHGGEDFRVVCQTLTEAGYRVGALEIDAARFTPQSRPRLFIVASRSPPPSALTVPAPQAPFHSPKIVAASGRLDGATAKAWTWWRLEPPAARNLALADLLEPDHLVRWRSNADTERLISQMSPRHLAQWRAAVAGTDPAVAAIYRRTRQEDGRRVQRAELRLDGLAGCLRTPGGGSSKQFILKAVEGQVRSRLLTPREGARLMGLPDGYRLPKSATNALKVVGDGVAAPVVAHLGERLLRPVLEASNAADWSAVA
ncbi:MAG: DNA cytosine methyltransferase [Pseudomonadota bacterium]|jgi:DNA (cytosine-5)-methyltransferase 1